MKHAYRWLIGALVVVVLATVLALMASWGQDSLAQGDIIYVDADASGANSGTSWSDAFLELQDALDTAGTGDQIWVAEGTYKPTAEYGGVGDRYRSFQMKNGVAIYGGFAGTEVSLEERDWQVHETILSGDLNGDDGPDFANNEENSYHVFYHPDGTDLDSTAILDGVTISAGNANGEAPFHDSGGGMANFWASPTLTNCTFSGNSANQSGGGMYSTYTSSPTLTGCTFSDNLAATGGGMRNSSESSPTLTDCTFSGNSADYGGGMDNNASSSPTLANCTFSGNSAVYYGGGMLSYSSSPVLTNCTITGNLAEFGGGMYNNASSPVLTNCTFSTNSADLGGAMYNNVPWPTLTNCILWGDTSPEIHNSSSAPVVTYSDVQGGYEGEGNIDADPLFVDAANGDFHLALDSPCIDVGDNNALQLPEFDFEGDGRVLDGDGNVTAIVDMGVDEVAVAWPYFRVYLPVALRDW